MNKHKAVLFDVIGALLLFGFTALSIFWTKDSSTIQTPVILGLLSLNVALLWGRFRIHIDHKAGELREEIMEYIRLFAPNKELAELEMKIIKNPIKVEELVQEFRKACDNLRHIIDFVYYIKPTHRIYNHDIKKIKNLKSGQSYRATHSFAQMTDVWNVDESAVFISYMKAQYEAKNRGANVVRIYIVDKVDEVHQSEKIREHFKEMCDNGIIPKIVTRDRLIKENNEDFIIIGNTLLGLGKTENGRIVSAEYYCGHESRDGMFEIYDEYFEQLVKCAHPYRANA